MDSCPRCAGKMARTTNEYREREVFCLNCGYRLERVYTPEQLEAIASAQRLRNRSEYVAAKR